MSIVIRPMSQADKPAVLGFLSVIPQFPPSDVRVAEEVIDSYLADPEESGYFIQVAEVGGEIVGYIAYGSAPLTEGTWDFYWAAVTPELQGQGIGRSLFEFAENEIRRVGRLILIETSSIPLYDRTRRLYRRLGYRVVCRIPDYYAPGDGKLVFQKRLDKP